MEIEYDTNENENDRKNKLKELVLEMSECDENVTKYLNSNSKIFDQIEYQMKNPPNINEVIALGYKISGTSNNNSNIIYPSLSIIGRSSLFTDETVEHFESHNLTYSRL